MNTRSSRLRWVALLAATLVSLANVACEGHQAGHQPVVTDSAGIRVVVNPHVSLGNDERWRISPDPALQLGVVDGPAEYQFDQVRGGALLSDGMIVVADRGSAQFRFYDAQGRYLHAAGGPGDGPGEFRSLTMMSAFARDSLLAWDIQLFRVSIFDRSGSFVRSFSPVREGRPTAPLFAGVLSDGTLLFGQAPVYFAEDQELGVSRRPVALRLLEPDGAFRRELGEFPGNEFFVDVVAGGSVAPLTFGRRLHFSAGANRIAVANDDAFSIRVYDGAGTLTHVVRQERQPTPIAEAHYQRALLETRDNTPPGLRRLVEETFDRIPRVHTTFPAFESVRVDHLGYLWVEEYRPPNVAQPAWNVFDTDGFLVARLETPANFQILDIGEEYVLGVFRDAVGVEFVQMYRIERDGR